MLTDNILELIGNTPLLQLRGENIFAKAEFLNPGGSIKDRVAVAMLEAAHRDGKLSDESIIALIPMVVQSSSLVEPSGRISNLIALTSVSQVIA